MNNYTVYVLIDPRTFVVRYVGVTKCSLRQRLANHLRPSTGNSKKTRAWLSELKSLSLAPIIVGVFNGDMGVASELERTLIANQFTELFQKHRGGGLSPTVSAETRAVLVRAAKKRDNSYLRVRITCSSGVSFGSVKEASKFYGISSSNISQALTGKQRRAGGFSWAYAGEKK